MPLVQDSPNKEDSTKKITNLLHSVSLVNGSVENQGEDVTLQVTLDELELPESESLEPIGQPDHKRWISSSEAVRKLQIFRVFVWMLVRTCLDVWMIRVVYREKLYPFGSKSHRLSFGSRVILWGALPAFLFGLNPFWLFKMIKTIYHEEFVRRKKV